MIVKLGIVLLSVGHRGSEMQPFACSADTVLDASKLYFSAGPGAFARRRGTFSFSFGRPTLALPAVRASRSWLEGAPICGDPARSQALVLEMLDAEITGQPGASS